MEKVKIEAYLREKTGKEIAKKVRREGKVPAIVYGKDKNVSITVDIAGLKILKSIKFSESTILDMDIIGGEKRENIPVMIKDIQYHPVTDRVSHIDFMKVSLEEKIRVNVPLVLQGEAKGVKEGGIIEQILWEMEIEGFPLDIPEKIEVDVSALGVGFSLHAEDIKVADNLRITTRPHETIVTVVAKAVEEEAVEAPVEGIPQGPEVIKEKKEEKEEEKDKKEKKEK